MQSSSCSVRALGTLLNYWNNFDQLLLNGFDSITSPKRSLQVIPVIQQRPLSEEFCKRPGLNVLIDPEEFIPIEEVPAETNQGIGNWGIQALQILLKRGGIGCRAVS